jgi:NitT/TauT family transport system substrate-binding protein
VPPSVRRRPDFSPRAASAPLILLLLLTACSRDTPKTLPVRLAVGGQAQLIYLVATLAQSLGFYRAEGLDVTIQDFPGGSKSLEALLGGSTDVVCGFYDHTIQMAAQGKDVRAFLSVLRYPGLVAVAGPKISSIADLKGKVVGVSSAGSSTQMFLNYLLSTHGISPADVSVASIGMSATAVAAITHSKVDAAMMTDPALEIVLQQMPGLKILADTRTAAGTREAFGVEAYPSVVLYSTPRWLDAHREEATRMARAGLMTMDWLRANSVTQIRERMPAEFRTGNESADTAGLEALKAMLSPDGKLNLETAAAVRKVLSVSIPNLGDAKIDLAQTFTNSLIK